MRIKYISGLSIYLNIKFILILFKDEFVMYLGIFVFYTFIWILDFSLFLLTLLVYQYLIVFPAMIYLFNPLTVFY